MTTKQTPKKFQYMDTKVGDMLTCVTAIDADIYTVGKSYEVFEGGISDNWGASSLCPTTRSTFVHNKGDTVNNLKYKVGDTVVITGNTSDHEYLIGADVVITKITGNYYLGAADCWRGEYYFNDTECTLAIREEMTPVVNKTSSGGPSAYYDMPYSTWITTNDQMEYLAEHKWGKYAIHLKDIFKGLCRWGDKSGTTVEYDSRKIIYYGCRVLMMVVGAKELRVYLNVLLDDKQFQVKGDD
jgi:hypothetical protein